MFMLVANPTLNIILWIMIVFFLVIMGVCIYFLQEWLRSDTIMIVNKDGSIRIKTRIITKDERIAGQIKDGKHTYILEPMGVHTSKSFPQWKKIYVFDEGISMPRKIEYRKDAWFSTETIQKILNDTRIKMLTKEALDPQIKLFIILGAIAGFLAAVASIINLMINLGIIKK
jgi:hypothetical protein